MNEKLGKDKLLLLLDKLMRPKAYGLSEKESDNATANLLRRMPRPCEGSLVGCRVSGPINR